MRCRLASALDKRIRSIPRRPETHTAAAWATLQIARHAAYAPLYFLQKHHVGGKRAKLVAQLVNHQASIELRRQGGVTADWCA